MSSFLFFACPVGERAVGERTVGHELRGVWEGIFLSVCKYLEISSHFPPFRKSDLRKIS